MNLQTPPPLPDRNSALRTYLRAVALLIPTFLVWAFANVFLLPKLEQIWTLGGLTGSKAQWLVDSSRAFMEYGRFIAVGVVLLFVLLELRWGAWPRYRRTAVAVATLFFHTAVLIGVTAIATLVLVAVPVIIRHK